MPDSLEGSEILRKKLVAGLVIRARRLLVVHNTKHGLRIEPPGGKVKGGIGWYSFQEFRELEQKGILAPNLAAVLGKLESFL